MNRLAALTAVLITVLLALGCSGTGVSPLTPDPEINNAQVTQSQTQMWGYYTVYMDIEAQTVEAVANRNVQHTLNINTFLNSNPMTLGFLFNNVDNQGTYLDVNIDVSIMHPLPGKPQFNGYDVRGTLISNGSATMAYNGDLVYPTLNVDQYLLNADGYTRWHNKPEFIVPGVGGYTPGLYSAGTVDGTATLNPYKYFADGITESVSAYAFLAGTTDDGVFSSGTTNTRNYQIRFPLPVPAVSFDYSILANWQAADVHPANGSDPMACDLTITPHIYFVDPTDNGGDLILDIGMFFWDSIPSLLFIESTVLSAPYELSLAEMTPTESGDHYAIWHVEIPADNVTGTEGNELWVIGEADPNVYTGPFGIPNDAQSDILAGFFRFDLFVADEPYTGNGPPVITDGVSGDLTFLQTDTKDYTVTANDPDLDTLTYDWTVTSVSTSIVEFSGPGDDAGTFPVDWTNDVPAEIGYEYVIDCQVTDSINLPVNAYPLTVTCQDIGGATTLYLYDGMVDDGDIVDGTWDDPHWEYCPDINAWDEYECGDYPDELWTACRTPYIQFPDAGEFTTIHLEIWHWGEMPEDGFTYGDVGTAWDNGGVDYQQANWVEEWLVYVDGMDFNDPGYADFIGTYASEADPAWSHFECNEYAGENWAICFALEEWGASSGGTYGGWHIRKLHVWYE